MKQQNPQQQNIIDYERALKDAQTALKRVDKKLIKKSHTVPKGTQYDWLNNTSFNNTVYPKDKIPDRLLRMIEKRNGIVASIITLRIQQAIEFSRISSDKDSPGWGIFLKDSKETMTPEQEKQKKFLENLLTNTKRDDYQGLEPKDDTFKNLLIKYVRDRILIDKVVWEIERDRAGRATAIWVLDGATILPILPGGFYGSTSQVGYGIGARNTKLSEAIRTAKLEQIPPVEEIAYIQELIYGTSGGGITAAFTSDDLIYDLGNELNDVMYYKQGLSVTEKANIAIVAFMNSITFNSNGLSRGAIPKVAISMGRESGYTEEQLEDMQDEWMANFEAMDGQWNIPLLNGDAKVLPLLQSNRDMEYQKYMEFVGALTCSIMGVDSAELGLRLNQAQAVLSENQDAKQMFSKNRGVREMLNGFSYIANKFLKKSRYEFAENFIFKFTGLSTEDKNFEVDLKKKKCETYMTINEIRAEDDLDPLENGDIILNPTFLQEKQASVMGGAEDDDMQADDDSGGFGGFSEDEVDDMVDDALDEGMEKAIKLI